MKYTSVKEHYGLLIRENNDPFRDPDFLRQYMDNWDGSAFVDALALTPQSRVLEIGVGTGRLAGKILDLIPQGHFTGIDLSPLTVERAAENLRPWPNVTLINGDFLDYHFCTRFDVVYSSLTFFHIENKSAAIKKAAELLNPGGQFVLSVPREKETEIDFATRKVALYPDDIENIRGLAAANGLEQTRILQTPFADVLAARRA